MFRQGIDCAHSSLDGISSFLLDDPHSIAPTQAMSPLSVEPAAAGTDGISKHTSRPKSAPQMLHDCSGPVRDCSGRVCLQQLNTTRKIIWIIPVKVALEEFQCGDSSRAMKGRSQQA